MRVADCHPDRKHEAKGLCKPCYEVQRVKVKPLPKTTKATCCPDKPHYALGKCRSHYQRARWTTPVHEWHEDARYWYKTVGLNVRQIAQDTGKKEWQVRKVVGL